MHIELQPYVQWVAEPQHNTCVCVCDSADSMRSCDHRSDAACSKRLPDFFPFACCFDTFGVEKTPMKRRNCSSITYFIDYIYTFKHWSENYLLSRTNLLDERNSLDFNSLKYYLLIKRFWFFLFLNVVCIFFVSF